MDDRKLLKILFTVVMAGCTYFGSAQNNDWANYSRYDLMNNSVEKNPDVVFMGNSITDGWDDAHPEFFTDNNFACRGISGQVSSQMLCRFRSDVVNLHPKVVVILAGVNDIAGNNGEIDERHIVENIASMVDIARANGIISVFCTPLPADRFWWRPEFENAAGKIKSYKDALKKLTEQMGVTYVDYYTSLATETGAINELYSDDVIHPNRAGYDIMEPIILDALAAIM